MGGLLERIEPSRSEKSLCTRDFRKVSLAGFANHGCGEGQRLAEVSLKAQRSMLSSAATGQSSLSAGWRIISKNAMANILRSSTAGVVAVVLTPFLTRMMVPDAYGTWILILQLSAYTAYLDFGIQTAVGRFVAHATERCEFDKRNEIASTAMGVLLLCMLAALALISVGAWQLPHLFPQMSVSFRSQASWALFLVGASLAVGLPASLFNGVFIGLQRNEVPALTIGLSRVVGAVLLVLVVRYHGSLIAMALAVCSVNLLTYTVQYFLCRRLASGILLSTRKVTRRAASEIVAYCLSLSIWSFATLLVTGLDTTLVGVFDFAAVPYYAVAATVITFLLGLQNAIFGALISAAAVLDARGASDELGAMLVSSTRYGMLLLLGTGIPLLLAARPILTLWVGSTYAGHAGLLLQVLVLANIIRLSAVPYAMLLIGTGQQRLVTISPILEGCTNLVVSVICGVLMGAVGVAIGTLVGAIVGIACNLFYNMRRSTMIAATRSTYLKEGILRPLLGAIPVCVIVWLTTWLPASLQRFSQPLIICGCILSILGVWRFGLSATERRRLTVAKHPQFSLGH
jgi:O-antigen/teichoic acid export membrane protein